MIYPFERVPVPEWSGFTLKRNDLRYLYAYVGERIKMPDGKTRHPRARAVGQLDVDAKGNERLIPNTAYYELMQLAPPAVAERAGRKPKVEGKPLTKRAEFSTCSFGYGMVVGSLLAETGVTECLEKAFPKETVAPIQTVAAYLCDAGNGSFSRMQSFVAENPLFDVSPRFDRRRAGELLTQLPEDARGAFFSAWNRRQSAGDRYMFYDVTSYSTYSRGMGRARFGYNRDDEDLPQINVGLFCGRETGQPRFLTAYDGSLNDAGNFPFVMRQADAHHLKCNERNLTVVMDGGFSQKAFSWLHLRHYGFIAGISCLRHKAVRELYLRWVAQLPRNLLRQSCQVNERFYVLGRQPFTFANVDGFLLMGKDLEAETQQRTQLLKQRQQQQRVLQQTPKAPATDFDTWARSFAPFFKVVRARGPRGFTFSDDLAAWGEAEMLAGRVTLFFTASRLSDREVLEIYRSKEKVEDCFDIMKNSLSDQRLHVHGDLQADGKLFLLFVALILRQTILQRSKAWRAQNAASVDDVIDELKAIRYIKFGRQWVLQDALTKRQRELLTELNPAILNRHGQETESVCERKSHQSSKN